MAIFRVVWEDFNDYETLAIFADDKAAIEFARQESQDCNPDNGDRIFVYMEVADRTDHRFRTVKQIKF